MRFRTTTLALQFVCFLIFAAAAGAQHTVFHFEPSQTQIRWKLHENLRVVHGTFTLSGGMLALNAATGDAQGEILVDTDTVQSGNSARDERLKKDVLDTTTYPQAFFHATRVSSITKDGTGQKMMVGGLFNLHGSDHPFTIAVHVEQSGDRAQVATQFKVPYAAWGLKRPGGFLWRSGKEIEIEITSQARVEEVH